MSDVFSGFPREALEFLDNLGSKDKPWFDEHRQTYDRCIVGPTKAFVRAMGDRLQETISPAIEAQPKTNGSIAPINNDLRFSPDASPYKDHLLLKFWEGPNKKAAPTLFIRPSADAVGFASGAILPDLDRWRALIADETTGRSLAAAIEQLGHGRLIDVAGQHYKRVPKPYPADHPRADLLRHKVFQARWSEPMPASVHSAEFVDFCAERLHACARIHHWLVTNLNEGDR